MDIWQTSLLCGAIVAVLLSYNVSRAGLWVILATGSFVASTAWARMDLFYPPFFTMMCDVAVCLAIFFLAHRRWEIWLYRVFMLSVLLSLAKLSGMIGSHYLYVAGLELVNWTALALIGGAGIVQMIGAGNGDVTRRDWRSRVRSAYNSVFADRRDKPFHRQGTKA